MGSGCDVYVTGTRELPLPLCLCSHCGICIGKQNAVRSSRLICPNVDTRREFRCIMVSHIPSNPIFYTCDVREEESGNTKYQIFGHRALVPATTSNSFYQRCSTTHVFKQTLSSASVTCGTPKTKTKTQDRKDIPTNHSQSPPIDGARCPQIHARLIL